MMRARFAVAGIMVALVAATAGIIVISDSASSGTDTVESAPFTWQGAIWCPTYRGNIGCDDVQQKGILSSAAFYPSQIIDSDSSHYLLLKMDSDASRTGAFNSERYETWSPPAMLSEQINLPCDTAGKIENWPAFWLVATGPWPAAEEIDVMEGLNGYAAWHYHYVNSFGKQRSVGGVVSGFSGCGIHTYAVNWTRSAITFYYDDIEVGRVTSIEIGVPIASGPMYVIDDYAASPTYGGPTIGNANMVVLKFSS
jgi:Glycosyl hydrolases family 16